MAEITQTELANKYGETPSHIAILTKRGRLSRLPNGMYDEDVADEEYGEYLKGSNRAKTKAAQNQAIRDKLGISYQEQREKAETARATYSQAKAEKEAAVAKIKMLELAQLEGTLIAREEVERITEKIAADVLQEILAVPVRIATQCEGKEARQIERLMFDELNKAVERLHRSFLDKEE